MLDYEKLDVYRLALAFIAETQPLTAGFPKGHAELLDQFRRASYSVALNIAEGAGKIKIADKQRFYAIARGSAMECAALIDIFGILGLFDVQHLQSSKGTLLRVVSMLSVLCLSGKS